MVMRAVPICSKPFRSSESLKRFFKINGTTNPETTSKIPIPNNIQTRLPETSSGRIDNQYRGLYIDIKKINHEQFIAE